VADERVRGLLGHERRAKLVAKHALQAMIEQYFAEDTFLEIGDGCVFTSLSTDMQRAAPEYRKRFEDYTVRICELFSGAIHEQFPMLSKEERHEKALFLYSGLVGTMSMARTMKDVNLAYQVRRACLPGREPECRCPRHGWRQRALPQGPQIIA
jgi:hypothetical protein